MLRSPLFSSAPALSRLLRHLVETALTGDASAELKEYSLGVEVFDRGESFDPRTDTIVRVQARRLRSKLQDYYRTVGQYDPVLIELPIGRYVPVFSRLASVQAKSDVDVSASQPGGRLRAVPKGAEIARQGLPAPRTPLIGRQRDIETVTALLRDESVRLVTLTGPGGSGKTRLALYAADRVAEGFGGRVLLQAVASLSDGGAIAAALAQLLGLRHAAGRPIREALRAHASHAIGAPTLLLLDNFEHVIDASSLIVDLIEASPYVKVLVTSRARLHVYGEHEHAVLPLELPDASHTAEVLERNPAVQLFLQRAQAIDRTFGLGATNAATVAAICRRLDGLPLAIELAAARIKLFPPDAMLPRLDRSLDFLTTGPRDAPARQRTLRDAIDWSHALLTEPEQRLFRRLAVFVGGFTLEAAEAVCNAYRDLDADVIEGVGSLLDKNLLHQVDDFASERRFGMLETLREYALQRLIVSGDESRMRRALAAYAIVLAEEGQGPRTAAERDAWLRRCDVESSNIRASVDWLIAQKETRLALRLALGLFPYWERRELLEESRSRLEAILKLRADQAPAPEWARLLEYLGAICDSQGETARAWALHQQALDEFTACGDKRGEAAQLNSLAANRRFNGDDASAQVYWQRALAVCREIGDAAQIAAALSNLALSVAANGDPAQARVLLEEARSIFEATGDELGVLWNLDHLGDVARLRGDAEEAERLYQLSLDGFTRAGDAWGAARCSADLAEVRSDRGGHDAARELLKQALVTFASLGHRRGVARILEGCALVAARQRQFEQALTLAGAAAAVRLALGAAPRAAEQARLEDSLALAWRSCPAADAQAAWTRGREMSLDDAMRFAVA
jgi:predicted ATPase